MPLIDILNYIEEILLNNAQVAELVDAHVSGACVERHAGSSPVLGTKVRIVQSFNQESERWRNW